jgi:recombination protein RecT
MTTTTLTNTNGNPGTALQPTREPATIQEWMRHAGFKNAIARALPKHMTADRFLRVAVTATAKNPKLVKCTTESFLNCLLTLSQFGLEPDGRRAHLIPFDNKKKEITECQLIIDYKGLAELVMRSGIVSFLHADIVREGDIFDYSLGEIREHVPWFLQKKSTRVESAGAIYAAFAMAKMKDGTVKCEVMSIEDVYAIRDKSQGWIAFQRGWAKQSPWDPKDPVSEAEMIKKTAFRRLSKWLPLSPEIRDAVEHDDEHVDLMPTIEASPANAATDRLMDLLSKANDQDGAESAGNDNGEANPPTSPPPNSTSSAGTTTTPGPKAPTGAQTTPSPRPPAGTQETELVDDPTGRSAAKRRVPKKQPPAEPQKPAAAPGGQEAADDSDRPIEPPDDVVLSSTAYSDISSSIAMCQDAQVLIYCRKLHADAIRDNTITADEAIELRGMLKAKARELSVTLEGETLFPGAE